MERIVRPCSRGVGDGHVPTLLSRTEHAAKRLKPGGGELAIRHSGVECALRCGVIVRAAPRAALSNRAQVIERGEDPVAADVAEAERSDSRSVNHPGLCRVGQSQCDSRRGNVPAASRYLTDVTNCSPSPWDQGVDEGGLSDARVADKDATVSAQPLPQWIQICIGEAHFNGYAERLVLGNELVRSRKICLGKAEQRLDAGVLAGDEQAVDHPDTWRWIRESGYDDQLIRIRDDGALIRVVIVGRPPQDGGALFDLDDARQRALGA